MQKQKEIDQENLRMFKMIRNSKSSIKKHLVQNKPQHGLNKQLYSNGKYLLGKKAEEKAKIIVWLKLNKSHLSNVSQSHRIGIKT